MQNTFSGKIKKMFKKIPFVSANGKVIRRMLKPLWWYMLRRTTKPLSNHYGFDRGTPIDRFYIEDFLEKNKLQIKGKCLEVLSNNYMKKFGAEKVTISDVIDIDEQNKNATILADLRDMPGVPSNNYDCIILTQVLQFIDEPVQALREIHRILKPGGYVLATLPAVSRIDCTSGVAGDFWRFTQAGAHVLFKNFSDVKVANRGNCRSGMLFLAGVSQEEVSKKILEADDEQFPVIITVLAKK